jgi:hypothetical protein
MGLGNWGADRALIPGTWEPLPQETDVQDQNDDESKPGASALNHRTIDALAESIANAQSRRAALRRLGGIPR